LNQPLVQANDKATASCERGTVWEVSSQPPVIG